VKVVDLDRGDAEVMDWRELRTRSIEWYRREAGVDFSAHGALLARRMGPP
jgi:hypothetical protein